MTTFALQNVRNSSLPIMRHAKAHAVATFTIRLSSILKPPTQRFALSPVQRITISRTHQTARKPAPTTSVRNSAAQVSSNATKLLRKRTTSAQILVLEASTRSSMMSIPALKAALISSTTHKPATRSVTTTAPKPRSTTTRCSSTAPPTSTSASQAVQGAIHSS